MLRRAGELCGQPIDRQCNAQRIRRASVRLGRNFRQRQAPLCGCRRQVGEQPHADAGQQRRSPRRPVGARGDMRTRIFRWRWRAASASRGCVWRRPTSTCRAPEGLAAISVSSAQRTSYTMPSHTARTMSARVWSRRSPTKPPGPLPVWALPPGGRKRQVVGARRTRRPTPLQARQSARGHRARAASATTPSRRQSRPATVKRVYTAGAQHGNSDPLPAATWIEMSVGGQRGQHPGRARSQHQLSRRQHAHPQRGAALILPTHHDAYTAPADRWRVRPAGSNARRLRRPAPRRPTARV
jgi:hypothetical protein